MNNFTNLQINTIKSYLDQISDYLHQLYNTKASFISELAIDNPNEKSLLKYIRIDNECIYIGYSNLLFELNKDCRYEDSIYNYPTIGYELLLNWKAIKEEVLHEIEQCQEKKLKVEEFLNNFEI